MTCPECGRNLAADECEHCGYTQPSELDDERKREWLARCRRALKEKNG